MFYFFLRWAWRSSRWRFVFTCEPQLSCGGRNEYDVLCLEDSGASTLHSSPIGGQCESRSEFRTRSVPQNKSDCIERGRGFNDPSADLTLKNMFVLEEAIVQWSAVRPYENVWMKANDDTDLISPRYLDAFLVICREQGSLRWQPAHLATWNTDCIATMEHSLSQLCTHFPFSWLSWWDCKLQLIL